MSNLRFSSNSSPRPVAILLVAVILCLANRALQETVCFSTPLLRNTSTTSSAGRQLGGHQDYNYGATKYQQQPQQQQQQQQPDEMYEYTNNYIMAIEDTTTQPTGFMVSTTDSNYAIQSPSLSERNWQSLTQNGIHVFILTNENKTISSSLFSLSEEDRDFIAEIRSRFTNNLAGLKFAYYTSSSSLILPAPGESASGQRPGSPSSSSSPSYGQAPATIAAGAINELNNVHRLASLQEQSKRRGIRLHEPVEGRTGETLYSLSGQRSVSLDKVFKTQVRDVSKRQVAAGAARHLGARFAPYNNPPAIYGRSKKKAGRRHSAATAALARAKNAAYVPKVKPTLKNGLCAFQSLINFNYYNLNSGNGSEAGPQALNRTLSGDIYYFDFHCNILDVYSSTVSVRQVPNGSILYRDHRYFSYARSRLPLEINRFFLVGDQVFLVYNDGSLILKQSWMLDPVELELILNVRQEIRNLSEWQSRAARLIGGNKPPPARNEPDNDKEEDDKNGDKNTSETTTSAPEQGEQSDNETTVATSTTTSSPSGKADAASKRGEDASDDDDKQKRR